MSYDIKEHKHRYAAWAASRASSVKGCRFKVRQGGMIIKHLKLDDLIDCPENDCPEKLRKPYKFDSLHRDLRKKAVSKSEELGLNFTHGVAAKLINIYMKTIFICGGYTEHAETKSIIHPPIDSLLLKALYENDIGGPKAKAEWHKAIKIRWSKFDSNQYEEVIENIRKVLNGEPLWKIEEYWQGYR